MSLAGFFCDRVVSLVRRPKSLETNDDFIMNNLSKYSEKNFAEFDEGSSESSSSSSIISSRCLANSPFHTTSTELAQHPDNFRSAYLGKLAYRGSWKPREARAPSHRTVTIFDWDDTLLCTAEIMSGNLDCRPATRRRKLLKSLAASARQLLEAALEEGQTFIVTNASDGWVQQSARLYLPELLPILSKIPIISARSRFEDLWPKNPEEWKVQAFLELSSQFDLDNITNLVVIGDSFAEIKAGRTLASELSNAVVKTIKLCEDPTLEDLCAEHMQLLQSFARIAGHASNASSSASEARGDSAKMVAAEDLPQVGRPEAECRSKLSFV
eukprot:CAMPEP_0206481064 /NCGR_PEP_ID=MMETSP0324_2-20121206/37871_1 /ASSEMBLY_ACC=CAM_ASM_000836 /TAXON_ID=2866 /ORGANISM="Crypthecodinium cohnii, Strain Seligo" /LENGTH=326 /DNA_ID=CAMNT_0053958379 /DNA_START=62 /DNA_END=1043 /DNA_ORIENTATION=+